MKVGDRVVFLVPLHPKGDQLVLMACMDAKGDASGTCGRPWLRGTVAGHSVRIDEDGQTLRIRLDANGQEIRIGPRFVRLLDAIEMIGELA